MILMLHPFRGHSTSTSCALFAHAHASLWVFALGKSLHVLRLEQTHEELYRGAGVLSLYLRQDAKGKQ